MKYFCVNLFSRGDRWSQVKNIFQGAGIKVDRFDAQECKEYPWYGCTLSHLGILKLALREKWEYVCVFEDDICFYRQQDFKKELRESLEKIPNDWHILYLGGLIMRNAKLKKINNKILKIEGVLCTYGILYHLRSYAILINNLENVSKQNNIRIDHFLGEKYQSLYPCYITSNLLVHERNDFSNIENTYKKTEYIYKMRFLFYKYGYGWMLNLVGELGDFLKVSNRHKAQNRR